MYCIFTEVYTVQHSSINSVHQTVSRAITLYCNDLIKKTEQTLKVLINAHQTHVLSSPRYN